MREQIKPLLFGRASDFLGSLGIVVALMALGAVLGLCGALLAVEGATGDARGGELLFLGLLMIAGAGLGFGTGLIVALRWLQSRRQRQCDLRHDLARRADS